MIYHSTNGYADSWGKLYPFYVNKLCHVQDAIEQHLATDTHPARLIQGAWAPSGAGAGV